LANQLEMRPDFWNLV